MAGPPNNGWTEWSKHVLKELERLNDSQEALRTKLEEVQQAIAGMQSGRDIVDDLKIWKKEIDEVISPTQLRGLVETVDNLEKFKVKAITVFIVLQTIIGIIIAIVI